MGGRAVKELVGNETEGLRYAVIETPEKYWLRWREGNALQSAGDNPLLRELGQLCGKERLLEIVHDFRVFDAGHKEDLIGIAHPSTVHGWRWLFRHRHERRLDDAFRRIERRILVDPERYRELVRAGSATLIGSHHFPSLFYLPAERFERLNSRPTVYKLKT